MRVGGSIYHPESQLPSAEQPRQPWGGAAENDPRPKEKAVSPPLPVGPKASGPRRRKLDGVGLELSVPALIRIKSLKMFLSLIQ